MRRPAWLLVLVLLGCGSNPGGGGGDDAGRDGGSDPDGGGGDGDTPDGNITTCGATELCDGVIDDDCDGEVDEGCGRCPLMTVACPMGCCPVDRWEVSTSSSVAADLAVDADGTIFFSYTVPSSGTWISYLAIYSPIGGTWRTETLGTGTHRTRVRIDHLGRVHVANGGGNGTLNYRRSDDRGATFPAPTALGQLAIGGTFDMEIDSLGQPHVVFAQHATLSPTSRFHYKHFDGTQWVTVQPDIVTTSISHPDLALGFADRPHVVFEAYDGDAMKQYLFHNGNRWVLETADAASTGESYTAHDYHAGVSLRIGAGDAREVLVTRRIAGTDTMILATRGAGDLDTWQTTPISGATDFTTPVMFTDADGKLAAIGDGLRLYRQQSGATWTTTELGVPGENVAIARRGSHVYVAYSADNGHPTLTVFELD